MSTASKLSDDPIYQRVNTVLENFVEDGDTGWKRSAVSLLHDIKHRMIADYAVTLRITAGIDDLKARLDRLERK